MNPTSRRWKIASSPEEQEIVFCDKCGAVWTETAEQYDAELFETLSATVGLEHLGCGGIRRMGSEALIQRQERGIAALDVGD